MSTDYALRRGSPRAERGLPVVSRFVPGLAVVVVSLGGGYAMAAGGDRTRATALLIAACLAATITFSIRPVATFLLYLGAATSAMNSIRIGGAVTSTDVFLLGAAVMLLPSLLTRRRLGATNGLYLTAGVVLILGALLGATSVSQYSANLAPLVKLVVAVFLVYGVFLAWAPSPKEAWRFVSLYVGSACVSAVWGVLHLSPYDHRAEGLAVHSNHLALVSLLALGPAVAVALLYRGRTGLAGTAAAVILLVGIGATGSRAGVIGVAAIALLAVVLLARKRAARIVLFAALTVMLAAPLLIAASPNENAFNRLSASSSSAQQSDVQRRQLISEAVALIEKHPLTGAGLEAAKRPHDIFLGLLSGGGPLALLGGVLLVAVPVRALRDVRPTYDASGTDALVTGLSLGALGFFTACLFQNTIWDRYIWIPLALLAYLSARDRPSNSVE